MKNIMLLLLLMPVLCFGQNTNKHYDGKNIRVNYAEKSTVSDDKCLLSGAVELYIDGQRVKCDSAVIDRRDGIVYLYGSIELPSGIATRTYAPTLPNYRPIDAAGAWRMTTTISTAVPYRRMP